MGKKYKIFLYFSLPIAIGCTCVLTLSAQQHKIDSLYTVLKSAKEDTGKVNTLNSLTDELQGAGKYMQADSLTNLAMRLAKTLNFKKGEIASDILMGYSCFNRGKYAEALKYQDEAVDMSNTVNYKALLGRAYRNMGSVYEVQGDYQQALKYSMLAVKADSETGNKRGMAYSYSNMGTIYEGLSNYAEALKYETLSLNISTELGNKGGIESAYGNIGNIYHAQSNFPEALKNYLAALGLAKELNDVRGMGNGYNAVGNVYYAEDNYTEALKYFLQSLEIKKSINNKRGMANTYGNIGIAYEAQGKYDDALQNYYQGLAISKELGDKLAMADAYINIGVVESARKNYVEAMKDEQMSLALNREIGNKYGISYSYEGIGAMYAALKQYNSSQSYLDSAVKLAKSVNAKDVERNTYYTLTKLDSDLGNYKAAYSNYKNFVVYRDSIINETNTKKIVQEQMQYDFDKKQATEKAEQDKKDAIAASDKKRQVIITASVSVVLLLVLLFSGLLLSRFRVTQKQKVIIEEQKAIVEEKNKDILDSITYAKRLQDAILPPMSVIEKYLPQSFVLYKPKDIVAGDFYWMERAGDLILIAAADCTGHGVPGAMVSVVCSNALNRAVKEFHITEPGKILDKTRELVLETFEKSEGEIKDGMDISLCAINTQTGKAQWSGAYNSLWYYQNGEMKELEADKQPIGKVDRPRPFSTKNINFNKEDIIYLFTDGYADQFGGQKGKKFKYQQLKEKLSVISQKPMAEQKQILEQTLEEWKGSLEQVDDILIIGLRV